MIRLETNPYAQYGSIGEAVAAQKPTGIKVIIVGAGIAGATAAVEARLNGHGPVFLYDSVKKFERLGDTISIMPNAGRIYARWPGFYDVVDACCGHARGIRIRRWDTGQILATQLQPDRDTLSQEERDNEDKMRREAPTLDIHRGDLHAALLRYCRESGVEFQQGVRISAYEETDKDASVIINGEKVTADVVLAADGIKSTGREIVLGFADAPKSSGYAIFRAFYPASLIKNNPLIGYMATCGFEQRNVWIGQDCHFICALFNNCKELTWKMTHLDNSEVTESWSSKGSVDDALEWAKGWDPKVVAIIEATRADSAELIDWKLCYRDPLPTWVSPMGRIALLGDAAHPFLPTSQQGGSQAIEDGTTIAWCLKLASKSDCPTALRTYQALRYDRVGTTQVLGEKVRERWHKISEFDNLDPESIKLRHAPEILEHDATAYTIEQWPAVSARVFRSFSCDVDGT